MLNKGKILWCIWAGILVLLFLMSSTDLIIKEKKIEVYPISVIIEGDNDDYYVNFKKGMDQAAAEFHGDVSFITLYASDDQAQQMELVKREIRDGTRAVILAPVKTGEAAEELENMNPIPDEAGGNEYLVNGNMIRIAQAAQNGGEQPGA